MPELVAANGREALIHTAHLVLDTGRLVAPRGQQTRELEHFTLEIENPRDILCTGIGANQSTKVIAAEALQLIGGFSDVAFAVRNAPKLAAFVNEDTHEFDGAYGPRLESQLIHLVDRLTADADTRQAVLSIWDRRDLARPRSKDYPCTLVLGFQIRRDALNLSVVMRSNDVNWGLKNDIFQFTQLQLSIASLLGIDAGLYRHTAFSMHLYERDWEWADALGEPDFTDEIQDHPTGIDAVNANDMMRTARAIAYHQAHYNLSASNAWYERQIWGSSWS